MGTDFRRDCHGCGGRPVDGAHTAAVQVLADFSHHCHAGIHLPVVPDRVGVEKRALVWKFHQNTLLHREPVRAVHGLVLLFLEYPRFPLLLRPTGAICGLRRLSTPPEWQVAPMRPTGHQRIFQCEFSVDQYVDHTLRIAPGCVPGRAVND